MWHMFFVRFAVLLLCFSALGPQSLSGQSSFEQTLPSGLLNTDGGSQTSIPFNSMNDSISQWHYDTSFFSASGPILINEIYVRASSPGAVVNGFSCSDLEITLIEATTTPGGASTIFANNILRAEVVRSGSYTLVSDTLPDGGTTASWIPLRLFKRFLYDPTSGNDLIIQVRVCGVTTPLGVSIDGEFVAGVERRTNPADCNAVSSTLTNIGFAPVVRIASTPVLEQSLPQGELAADSNSATSFLFNSGSDQKWQWHYDSGEFAASGPITISQISVRANGGAPVNAFDFPSLTVTLIEASTDYQVGNHDPTFANNVLRSKVVRSGSWSAPATASSGGGGGNWISFQLIDTFDYDPSSGNDLIVQLESCGTGTLWGVSVDGVLGGPGTVGGNRYGHTTNCTAISQSTSNNEFVPIVKVSYTEREITSFPFRENFDLWGASHATSRTPPGWIQDDSNSIDWRFFQRTTSVGTSNVDHTTGLSRVGFYLSTDDGFSSASELISTPIFNLATLANPMATFWVYSNSALPASVLDSNELSIDVTTHLPGGFTTTNFSVLPPVRVLRSGCWSKFAVDLSPYAGSRVSLTFEGTTDSSNTFYHDFAIDDFEVASAAPTEGGQGSRAVARLNINDCWNINGLHVESNAPGPYYACGKPAGEFHAAIEGAAPFQPTALWIGPLNIAVATFGPLGQMDTGTPDTTGDGIPESIFIFGSGLNPTPSFLDTFFFTNAAGVTNVSLTLNPALPFGVLGTFQAAAADGMGSIYLTNAVVFRIDP